MPTYCRVIQLALDVLLLKFQETSSKEFQFSIHNMQNVRVCTPLKTNITLEHPHFQ